MSYSEIHFYFFGVEKLIKYHHENTISKEKEKIIQRSFIFDYYKALGLINI
jgi:hypothetical protein